MGNPTITDYLKYANLQMAAEAFIRDEKTGALSGSDLLLKAALIAENKRASKFTEVQRGTFPLYFCSRSRLPEFLQEPENPTQGPGARAQTRQTQDFVEKVLHPKAAK